jgi:DNA-binding CsgD family transcriptional regulator
VRIDDDRVHLARSDGASLPAADSPRGGGDAISLTARDRSPTIARMSDDLLELLEAAYDVDAAELDWLAGMVRVGSRLFADGLGAAIYTYESGAAGPTIRTLQIAEGFQMDWLAKFRMRLGASPDVTAPLQWKRWFHQSCGTARTTPNLDELTRALEVYGGARDVFGINGRDPEGFGVFFAAPRPKPMRLGDRQREVYTRVAAHFAAGYRLRRRLAGERLRPDGADAVLAPGGKLLHASGDARAKEAREELVRAARRIDRARSRAGRKDDDAATRSWRGLVDGRWTLVDCFEHGGDRWVLAERNDLKLAEPPPLSTRERQVLAFASLDHTNKEIAYELGLSAATVRVLMARAARKLRVRGREEAIARFRALTRPPSS